MYGNLATNLETMKVTVSFDTVRVVVPCGDGQMLVSELIEQAVARFSKAVGKDPPGVDSTSWITVHCLKSSDGGILDADDKLCDVVDDKDHLNASYDVYIDDGVGLTVLSSGEQRQNGGDGNSACGSPTCSEACGSSSVNLQPTSTDNYAETDCLVSDSIKPANGNVLDGELSLLDMTSSPAEKAGSRLKVDHTGSLPFEAKRRSSAPSAPTVQRISQLNESTSSPIPMNDRRQSGNDSEENDDVTNYALYAALSRDPAHKSLNNSVAMMRWLDAQEKLADRYDFDEAPENRREPIGSANALESVELTTNAVIGVNVKDDSLRSEHKYRTIVLENPGGPLGIHVIPASDDSGGNAGLAVQSIQANSLVERDGRLRVDDRIVEINKASLLGLEFAKAQEVFKSALQSSIVQLQVIRDTDSRSEHDSLTPQQRSRHLVSGSEVSSADVGYGSVSTIERQNSGSSATRDGVKAKVPPAVPRRNSSTSLTTTPTASAKFTPISSTRMIGKVKTIDLVKGPQGLGFSVTTRDNPAGDDNPIYIKNILPQGAAVQDGRLQPGDRLLQVNGIDMSGMTQEEVVSTLRAVPVNDIVSLTVSRQVAAADAMSTQNSPAPSKRNKTHGQVPEAEIMDAVESNDANLSSESLYDLVSMSIPVELANGSKSSVLGASIKGKTTTDQNGTVDNGLFVKAIIEGGAAALDGRLRPDDRLLEINGVSLVGRSNADTMNTLREALRTRSIHSPNCIDLLVARPSRPSTDVASDPGVENGKRPTGDLAWEVTPRKPAAEKVVEKTVGDDLRTRAPPTKRSVSYQRANNSELSVASPSGSGSQGLTSDAEDAIAGNGGYSGRTQNGIVPTAAPRGRSATPLVMMTPSSSSGMAAPTITGGRTETVLIETEGSDRRLPTTSRRTLNSSSSTASSSSSGSSRRRRIKVKAKPTAAAGLVQEPPRPSHLPVNNAHDVTVASSDCSSPLDVNPFVVFSREAAGRQSMSEKRKAYMDPKSNAFYRQVKQSKGGNLKKYASDESLLRPVDNDVNVVSSSRGTNSTTRTATDQQLQAGGTGVSGAGMQRCCSLESINMAGCLSDDRRVSKGVHRQQPVSATTLRRNRGCNESFRAAVDRSYGGGANAGRDAEGDATTRQSRMSSSSDDSDKKSGKKQNLLAKAFGGVFKIGKSKANNDRERADTSQNADNNEARRAAEINNLPRTAKPYSGESTIPANSHYQPVSGTLPSSGASGLKCVATACFYGGRSTRPDSGEFPPPETSHRHQQQSRYGGGNVATDGMARSTLTFPPGRGTAVGAERTVCEVCSSAPCRCKNPTHQVVVTTADVYANRSVTGSRSKSAPRVAPTGGELYVVHPRIGPAPPSTEVPRTSQRQQKPPPPISIDPSVIRSQREQLRPSSRDNNFARRQWQQTESPSESYQQRTAGDFATSSDRWNRLPNSKSAVYVGLPTTTTAPQSSSVVSVKRSNGHYYRPEVIDTSMPPAGYYEAYCGSLNRISKKSPNVKVDRRTERVALPLHGTTVVSEPAQV